MVTTGDYIKAPPLEVNGIAYALSTDGNLYAVNATSGTAVWTYTTGPSNDQVAALGATSDGKRIYTTCKIDTDNNFYGGHWGVCAVDAKTGAQIWTFAIYMNGTYSIDSQPLNPPVVAGGKVFIGFRFEGLQGGGGTGTFALDTATGAQVWGIANNPEDMLPLAADKGPRLLVHRGKRVGLHRAVRLLAGQWFADMVRCRSIQRLHDRSHRGRQQGAV